MTLEGKITWEEVMALSLQYGLPFAEGLIQRATSGQPVTIDSWNALKSTIQQNTPENLVAQAATAAGIPATDPRYQQILALIQPKP